MALRRHQRSQKLRQKITVGSWDHSLYHGLGGQNAAPGGRVTLVMVSSRATHGLGKQHFNHSSQCKT